MKPNSHVSILLLAFALPYSLNAEMPGVFISTHIHGVGYEFEISRDRLEKTPVWKPDTEPPLLPGKASVIAIAQFRELISNPSPSDIIITEAIYLRAITPDHWIYIFQLNRLENTAGLSFLTEIPVLMDGTTIQPGPFRQGAKRRMDPYSLPTTINYESKGITFITSVFNVNYEFKMPYARLVRTPAWKPGTEPALLPGKARSIAAAQIKQLLSKAPETSPKAYSPMDELSVASREVILKPIDDGYLPDTHWIYLINLDLRTGPIGPDVPGPPCVVPVLMDGTTITPLRIKK